VRSQFPQILCRGSVPYDSFGCEHTTTDLKVWVSWSDLFTQASIISLAISLSLCSRCFANSGSGQWRSIIKICRASSFQNKSSEVAEPLLWEEWRRTEPNWAETPAEFYKYGFEICYKCFLSKWINKKLKMKKDCEVWVRITAQKLF